MENSSTTLITEAAKIIEELAAENSKLKEELARLQHKDHRIESLLESLQDEVRRIRDKG